METVLAILPLVMDLLGGLAGKGSSDKLAKEISMQHLSDSVEMASAEGVARTMAYSDMPGYQMYKENIGELMPVTMAQLKEVAATPSTMIDLASRTLTAQNKAYNELATKNAEFHLGNMQNYQQMLKDKGIFETNRQQENNRINIMAAEQEAQGNADLISSITRGVGSSISTYGMMKELDYQSKYYDKLGSFFSDASKTPSNETMANIGNDWLKPKAPATAEFYMSDVPGNVPLERMTPLALKLFGTGSDNSEQAMNELLKLYGFTNS